VTTDGEGRTRITIHETHDRTPTTDYELLSVIAIHSCTVVDMDPAEPEFEIARNELRHVVDTWRQRNLAIGELRDKLKLATGALEEIGHTFKADSITTQRTAWNALRKLGVRR
jgi:hypothetical protein